jgi:hypothetical protein
MNLTPAAYALALVKAHHSINAASKASGFARGTIAWHLEHAGIKVRVEQRSVAIITEPEETTA